MAIAHALVVRVLPGTRALRRFEIKNLEGLLEATSGFADAVTATGVDPADHLAAVAGLTPKKRLAKWLQATTNP
ncbi:MAG TPA: hypothetical protein VHR45_11010 [Thermoanaerobaculia bacterium]|nr:hypothetical protein [Thermoanaerobaculia bacterium]